ncbi:MAG: glutamine-hydrolyzing carbamoyl-phosphate synthase small subunit [Methanomassiliicoccaceae archaeon]|jgi:carbamoyl-phosphate synthase small subunit|nr:glutamine-hydrolyzing carbamoyl-phosphate synthase small subunit [Euryarchaeota archaeon]HOB38577.1 glutamine-hydrolyzing carbamoyl-phosphate synthase small subunit [Methanomassiliicoccaceae archaeon]HOL07086.1 glutamine-hydrolyzing carbamoyl-phosphate synthase small subunit [Methanomassiliicoccaceae archaeon]HQA20272.1 glutamine-hydrolyzing carbamoyl-phosphate synthase small subunit [Methanomassiliicoccaceae archaeon]HQD87301.1 glutamine-hydrolyzing carbamoyl-phosphate synthase small subuni
MVQCRLILENGTIAEGTGFGYGKTVYGEVVFNTGMAGYQECLTDPSYRGQILIMSHPVIGNYGVNDRFKESPRVQVTGLAVRELCRNVSPMYGGKCLDDYLQEEGVPGITELDTRSLVIGIREKGVLRGAITFDEDPDEVLAKVRDMKYPSERNLVAEVSTKNILRYENEGKKKVALIDCGVKASIINELRKRFSVVQVPYDVDLSFFRDEELDGIFISNGPGDPSHPEMLNTTVRTIKAIKDDYPMMGICLGNQLLALAFGGRTYKMKFGHRGVNQPVRHNGQVFITSQNHGYAVDMDSLDGTGFVADHININDGTVDGMKHTELPIMSVQYHPEARSGPQDTTYLFDEFVGMLEEKR